MLRRPWFGVGRRALLRAGSGLARWGLGSALLLLSMSPGCGGEGSRELLCGLDPTWSRPAAAGCKTSEGFSTAVDAAWAETGLEPDALQVLQRDRAARCGVDALVACGEALAADEAPVPPEAWATLARLIYVSSGDGRAAAAVMERAVTVRPGRFVWRSLQGRFLFQAQAYAEAVAVMGDLARAAEEQRALRWQMIALEYVGRIHLATGRIDQGGAALQASVELLGQLTREESGHWGCPYHALGELYSHQQRPRPKAEALALAADFEREDARTQLEAAVALYVAGDFERASEYMARAGTIEGRGEQVENARRQLARWLAQAAGTAGAGQAASAAGRARRAADLVRIFGAHEMEAAVRYEALAAALASGAASLREGPPSRAERLEAACEAFVGGDIEAAAEAAARAPAWKERRGLIEGVVALLERRYDDVDAILEAASARRPPPLWRDLLAAHLMLARRKHVEAIARLDGIPAAQRPRSDRCLDRLPAFLAALGRGWATANLNRHSEAVKHFRAALAAAPRLHLARLGLGNSLMALQRTAEARAQFEVALAARPNDPYARAQLGMARLQLGDLADAEVEFKRALREHQGDYSCPYEGLGLTYLRQGRHDEARRYFERAIAIAPDVEHKKYVGLAQILLAEGKVERARALLRKARANHPEDDEAARLLRRLEGPASASLEGAH